MQPDNNHDELVKKMVSKFLMWKLPIDFYPDGGISFDRLNAYDSPYYPIGTNLLNADQAKQMIEFMLKD
jgi:hypothetical protein